MSTRLYLYFQSNSLVYIYADLFSQFQSKCDHDMAIAEGEIW